MSIKAMPFQTYVDSRKQQHTIYMQEKTYSCSIACVCTLLNLLNDTKHTESEIRLLSQRFDGGYRPDPNDIDNRKATFIHTLGLFGEVSLYEQSIGTKSSAVSDVLADYNLYSHFDALKELDGCNLNNYKEKLKDKIVLLSAKTPTGRHSILIRDIREDGTMVIYDPQDGLIETNDITKEYALDAHEIESMLEYCAFAIYQPGKRLENSATVSNNILAYSYNF